MLIKLLLSLMAIFSTHFLSAQCPQLKSILVNSCGSSEGLNEFFVFKTLGTSVNINTMTINYPSFTYCNSGCGTNTLLNAPTEIAALNATAGCTLFQYATTIPANAHVIVFSSRTPSLANSFNFSSLCGSGPYYVIFTNNITITGRFVNSGAGTRALSVTFSASCTDAVSYAPNSLLAGDGAYVSYDDPGNAFYGRTSVCDNAGIILPLTIIDFYAENNEENNFIYWEMADLDHALDFIVEKSEDGVYFEELGKINIDRKGKFVYQDHKPFSKTYYRLRYFSEGKNNYTKIVFVDAEKSQKTIKIFPNPAKSNESLAYAMPQEEGENLPIHFEIMDNLGRNITQITSHGLSGTIHLPQLNPACYLLKIQTSQNIYYEKLWIE